MKNIFVTPLHYAQFNGMLQVKINNGDQDLPEPEVNEEKTSITRKLCVIHHRHPKTLLSVISSNKRNRQNSYAYDTNNNSKDSDYQKFMHEKIIRAEKLAEESQLSTQSSLHPYYVRRLSSFTSKTNLNK